MAELKKREKIILGVMGAVVLFGAVNFLLPSGKEKKTGVETAPAAEDMQTLIDTIHAGLKKNAAKEDDIFFINSTREWTSDPFLEPASYKKWIRLKAPVLEGKASERKVEFNYMGFIEAGGEKMAIVNGIEYKEGEKLEIEGFTLKSVTPQSVVLENTLTGIRQTVLLQEENEVVSTTGQ